MGCPLGHERFDLSFSGIVQGHRTDMAEYFTVDDCLIMQKAAEFQAKGLAPEEIVGRAASATGISPGLVEFILDSRLSRRHLDDLDHLFSQSVKKLTLT